MTTPHEILNTIRGFTNGIHYTYLLYYGERLGIFDKIKELNAPFSISELAKNLGFVECGVKRWCEAAYSIGILKLNDNKYSIVPEWLEIMTDESSKYFARYLPYCHLQIAEYLKLIPDALKTGKTMDYDSCSDDFIESVELDGIRFANSFIDDILPQMTQLKDRLTNGGIILDIGCGSGLNLIKLATRFPKAHFIGVDLSHKSIDRAHKNIQNAGLESRIELHCGCASVLKLKRNIDAITFIESLHEIDYKIRPAIFQNCHNLLSKDGFIMIMDFVAPSNISDLNKEECKFSALVNWFELVWNSTAVTREEIAKLLKSNSFDKYLEFPIADMVIACTAQKMF